MISARPQGRSAAPLNANSSASQHSQLPAAAENSSADPFDLSGPAGSQAVASQMSKLKPFGPQQVSTTAKEHDSWATFD